VNPKAKVFACLACGRETGCVNWVVCDRCRRAGRSVSDHPNATSGREDLPPAASPTHARVASSSRRSARAPSSRRH
jgi:hypothetical protein